MARRAPALALALLAGCGYAFSSGVSRLPAGAEKVFVRPLENRTADAEAGALVAAALRQELARRGAEGGPAAPAALRGEVESILATPATGATWRLTLVVRARLEAGGQALAEAVVRPAEEYLVGVDALESEGRRRVALQRAAERAGREIVERLERP
jgi:hypothetical protein